MSTVDYWPIPDPPFDDDDDEMPGQLLFEPEVLAAFTLPNEDGP